MQPDLQGIKVAVLGGDAREIILTSELVRLGATVKVLGLPVQNSYNAIECSTVAEALTDIQAVILPIPGLNKDGTIYSVFHDKPLELTENLLVTLPANTPVFAGYARDRLTAMTKRCNLRLIELLKRDDIAILNSIPSAEGAIQMAMEATPITIHRSNSFVLGFGRTGATIANLLKGMGANVTVLTTQDAKFARIYELGMRPMTYNDFPNYVHEADIIFNTVPAMVLTNCILSKASNVLVIIDVASPPGGTDFEAAKRFGIKALQAPGLPGKVAPKTAGQILARIVPRILAEELGI